MAAVIGRESRRACGMQNGVTIRTGNGDVVREPARDRFWEGMWDKYDGRSWQQKDRLMTRLWSRTGEVLTDQ